MTTIAQICNDLIAQEEFTIEELAQSCLDLDSGKYLTEESPLTKFMGKIAEAGYPHHHSLRLAQLHVSTIALRRLARVA